MRRTWSRNEPAICVPAPPADTCGRPCKRTPATAMLAITVAADAIPSRSPSKLTGRRHWIVVTILVLAIITGFGAIISTWVKRQVLDTHHWTTTTSKLLANDKIDAALGAYLTDQLFTQVDVAAQIRGVLPQPAQGLAAPAASALRQVADRAAPEMLARPGGMEG